MSITLIVVFTLTAPFSALAKDQAVCPVMGGKINKEMTIRATIISNNFFIVFPPFSNCFRFFYFRIFYAFFEMFFLLFCTCSKESTYSIVYLKGQCLNLDLSTSQV